jgi:hypothetical protein
MAEGMAGAWRVFFDVEIFFHDFKALNGSLSLAKTLQPNAN